MTSPNSLTKELVCRIVKEFSLDTVFRDLGILVATALANTIESRGLRPADYAELPDLADDLSERLMQELGRNPDTFALAFLTQLRNRG
jgi:hypothetical protein